MVGDGTCLENRRGESPCGFDPLSLRMFVTGDIVVATKDAGAVRTGDILIVSRHNRRDSDCDLMVWCPKYEYGSSVVAWNSDDSTEYSGPPLLCELPSHICANCERRLARLDYLCSECRAP
jgi:hypothetical protein